MIETHILNTSGGCGVMGSADNLNMP